MRVAGYHAPAEEAAGGKRDGEGGIEVGAGSGAEDADGMTARPQAKVIWTAPAPFMPDLFRLTLATTPSPRMIRSWFRRIQQDKAYTLLAQYKQDDGNVPPPAKAAEEHIVAQDPEASQGGLSVFCSAQIRNNAFQEKRLLLVSGPVVGALHGLLPSANLFVALGTGDLRSEHLVARPVADDVFLVLPVADGKAGQIGGAHGRGFHIADGSPVPG